MIKFPKVALCIFSVLIVTACVLMFSSCSKVSFDEIDITFVVDGEEYFATTSKTNEPIILPENPAKDGYEFDGWYLDEGKWKKPFTENTVADRHMIFNRTVYAKFTAITYNITYESVVGANTNPATYTVEDNIVLSPIEYSDYEFLGWYLDSDFKTKIDSIIPGMFGDITLYAKYDIPGITVNYNHIISVNGNDDNGVSALGASATDRLGNPMVVSAKLKSGEYKGGSYVVYELSVIDESGAVTTLDTIEIPVYDVNDIDFSYFAKQTTYIKLSSHGEEFDTLATDSFGEACQISVELLDGYNLEGGEIVDIRLVATDRAGNRKVSEDICNIQLYDTPTIFINEEILPVRENTDINKLFGAVDSFGASLPISVTASNDLAIGSSVSITVSAADITGQIGEKTFDYSVFDSSKPFAKLYVDNELWDIVAIEDSANYTLPLYELDEEFDTAGWLDASGRRYTNANGEGLINFNQSAKLYYSVIKSGYIPIFTLEDLYSMTSDNNYYLFADFDLKGAEWTPVGTINAPFDGEFIGQGHTISNFTVTKSTDTVGFFGYFTGSLQGLHIKNFSFATTYDKYCYVGGLIGYNDHGKITDCSATGNSIINAGYIKIGSLIGYNYYGEISNSYSSGQVSGSAVYYCYIGGFIGDNYYGKITNCYSSSTVKITPDCDTGYAGGLIGYNNLGEVISSYSTGNVTTNANRIIHAGGLVGSNSGSLTRCYSTGNVIANARSTVNVLAADAGGLVGRNQKGVITDCYATGSATSNADADHCSSYAGGLIGYTFQGAVNNCFAVGNVSSISTKEATFAGGLIAYNDITQITNSYRAAEQIFSVTSSLNTTTSATNIDGIETTKINFLSEEWIKSNLWIENIEAWIFSASYPMLAPSENY